jgi:hypothetical protein
MRITTLDSRVKAFGSHNQLPHHSATHATGKQIDGIE